TWVSRRDSPDQADNSGRCRRFLPSRKRPPVCRGEVLLWLRPHFRLLFRRQSDVRGLLRGGAVATRLRLYVNRCGTLHTRAPAEELDLASVPALQPGQSEEADAELLEVRLESRLSSTEREVFCRRSKRRAINILLPLFRPTAPKGASHFKELAASLKRCPDTKLEFFSTLLSRSNRSDPTDRAAKMDCREK